MIVVYVLVIARPQSQSDLFCQEVVPTEGTASTSRILSLFTYSKTSYNVVHIKNPYYIPTYMFRNLLRKRS